MTVNCSRKVENHFVGSWSKMRKNTRNWGFGAVWGSPPYGAQTPDLTGPCYSPGGPEKNSFYSGGIGPHLGEIWGFEIFNIAVFEPSLAKLLQKTRRVVSVYRPEVQWSSVHLLRSASTPYTQSVEEFIIRLRLSCFPAICG